MTDYPPFSAVGALPVGRTTMIEASAGTGKTYALTALTVRMVVELDLPISQILLVTFTRAATAELRGRVRDRLVEVERHLADPGPTTDEVLLHLADVDDAEREQRRQRAHRAVRDFDTAAVSTIHGFCSVVLGSLGLLDGRNLDAVPSESDGEFVAEGC
ncbi:MAG: UvrD-helicase domain-containing protein, partial [Actinomycetes bacterium]